MNLAIADEQFFVGHDAQLGRELEEEYKVICGIGFAQPRGESFQVGPDLSVVDVRTRSSGRGAGHLME